MLFRCCLLLCLVAGSRQLSITEFSVPSAVEADANAELKCRYSLDDDESDMGLIVKWWWTPSDSEDRKQLYQRIVGHDPGLMQHKIDIEIRTHDTIVLLGLLPNASGIYECEVWKIEEVRKHQTLIVYKGTEPKLNVSTIPDGPDDDNENDVLIECEVEDVAPYPYLTLSIQGEVVNMTETLIGPNEDGLYSVYSNITLSKNAVDGTEINCELLYKNIDVTQYKFAAVILYDKSGALTSTATPEDTTVLDVSATIQSNIPDDGIQPRGSFGLLLATSFLTHLMGIIGYSLY